MKLSLMYNGEPRFFTNEGVCSGDKTYPLVWTRLHNDDEVYVTGIVELTDTHMHGYPDDPHIILDTNYSSCGDKMYAFRTDKGFGPREQYFKETTP
jgi:hypothetical protein